MWHWLVADKAGTVNKFYHYDYYYWNHYHYHHCYVTISFEKLFPTEVIVMEDGGLRAYEVKNAGIPQPIILCSIFHLVQVGCVRVEEIRKVFIIMVDVLE